MTTHAPVSHALFQHMFATSPVIETEEAQCTDLLHSYLPSDIQGLTTHPQPLDLAQVGFSKRCDLSPLEQLYAGILLPWSRPGYHPYDGELEQGVMLMPQARETKVSTVQHVSLLGRQHGSLRIKTESMDDMHSPRPTESEIQQCYTPLGTRIARNRAWTSKKPRRKPVPHRGNPCTDRTTSTEDVSIQGPVTVNNSMCLASVELNHAPEEAMPPALPQKDARRTQVPRSLGLGLGLHNTLSLPPPRPRKSSRRICPVPELDPDSETDSIPSSADEPVL